MEEPLLDIDQIQANIAPGFRFPFQHLLAVRIGDIETGKVFINELLPHITTMREAIDFHEVRLEQKSRSYTFSLESFDAVESKPVWVNIGLGNRFLDGLGVTAPAVADRSFKLGLDKRSITLGDPREPAQEGHKSNWLVGGPDNIADVLVVVGSSGIQSLQQQVDSIDLLARNIGHTVVYQERGIRLEGDKEHFGFRDGISQPAIRGRVSENPDRYLKRRRVNNISTGPEYAAPGDELVWTGEFIFGYPKQSSNHFRVPLPVGATDPFLKNGSFLVFRRLKQDVRKFRDETARLASELSQTSAFSHFTPEVFQANIVGRWPDGSPLVRHPDSMPATLNEDEINYFRFGSSVPDAQLNDSVEITGSEGDIHGHRCPLHAHIRKVNPRDRETDLGSETNTQKLRIIRRGIPFGPLYDDDPEENNRGLLFLSYQTSIRDQFEQLTIDWVNSATNPEPGSEEGFDMILGQNGNPTANRERRCVFQNASGDNAKVSTLSEWIIPTGGGYFFCPSIAALTSLAAT